MSAEVDGIEVGALSVLGEHGHTHSAAALRVRSRVTNAFREAQ